MGTASLVAMGILAVAGGLCLLRLVRGTSIADRMVALDVLLVTIVAELAVWSWDTNSTDLLAVMVVLALLGFTGTVTVARFVERRGAR